MDASSSLNIQGVLFLFLTNATFENVFAVINVSLKHKRNVVARELNGIYYLHADFFIRIADILT
jgi:hypothetical protein